MSCGADAYVAAYEVRFDRADLLAVPADHYSGGVMIEVSLP